MRVYSTESAEYIVMLDRGQDIALIKSGAPSVLLKINITTPSGLYDVYISSSAVGQVNINSVECLLRRTPQIGCSNQMFNGVYRPFSLERKVQKSHPSHALDRAYILKVLVVQ